MGLFNSMMDGVKKFKEAAKAGKDFNPMLEEVIAEIEKLHSEGKLDGVVYQAEQAYTKEHEEYKAKGVHTDAADSRHEVAALKHFLEAMASADDIEGPIKEKIANLEEVYKKMMDVLGPLGKLV